MTIESHQIINADNNEITLKDLILKIVKWGKYLFSKWLIILIFGLIGAIIGFVYSNSKKPVYTASTTFVLEGEKESGLGNLAGIASMAGLDLGSGGGGLFQGENIVELYRSRKMITQTLLTKVQINGQKRRLIDIYIEINDLSKQWAEKRELFNINDDSLLIKPNRLRDSVILNIAGDITSNYLTVSKPDKKLNIIQVDVKATDELFAKTFNDAIVQNVNDFYLQTKTKKLLQNVQIMQEKTDSVRNVMNGAIYTSAIVSDETPNLNPTRQVQRVAPTQKAQFSAETNKAVLGALIQNLEMSKLNLMKETPLIQIIDQPIYPLKRDKFGKLKGFVIGGLLFGFLTVVFLLIRKTINSIIA